MHIKTMSKYLKTTEKVEVKNYPYGYSQRTSMFFSIEFKASKGFRTVRQTINPKTGLLNKPKMSTYSPVRILKKDDTGKITSDSFDFYGDKGMQRAIDFFSSHYDLFTPEQQEYLKITTLKFIKVDIQANATYCGSSLDKLLPLYEPAIKLLVKMIKEKTNEFDKLTIPFDEIKALEVPGYNPFTITSHKPVRIV